MSLPPFALERFFARWEFVAPYVICASDVEAFRLGELLALADDETRDAWDRLSLGYTQSAGDPRLRAEIASLYAHVSPEEVLVFAGAEEGIYCFMRAVLQAGDRVLVTWPAYASLHAVAREVGAEVERLPLDPSDWTLDLGLLREKLRTRTRAVVVNFPHNPTGALPSSGEWRSLIEICRDAGALLFSDEVYRHLEHDGAGPRAAAVDAYEDGVSLGVLSKSFALPGLRIGWIAARDPHLLRRVAAYKDYTTICASAPSELLAIVALRAREAVLGRSREIVAANLAHADGFFARMQGRLEWVRPRGGSTAFPRFVADVDVERLSEELVRRTGVLILPGALMEHPGPHFRLGLGRRDLSEGLQRLEEYVATGIR